MNDDIESEVPIDSSVDIEPNNEVITQPASEQVVTQPSSEQVALDKKTSLLNSIYNYIVGLFKVKGARQVLSVIGGLIVLFIVFKISNPNFGSIKNGNIKDMLQEIGPYLLVGIGQSLVLITGNIDLSIGNVVFMSGMIGGQLIATNGVDPILAVFIALIVCAMVGVLNGQLVARFKIPPFIATLGTMFLTRGISNLLNNGAYTSNIIDKLGPEKAEAFSKFFYYGGVGIFSITLIMAMIALVIVNIMLTKTKMGKHIYAIGSNLEASRLSGVNVVRTTTIVYLISSLCAGLVGIMLLAQSGNGAPQGAPWEMYAVAVAVIGGVSVLGGSGLMVGTIVGAFLWIVLQTGLRMSGLGDGYRYMLIGAVVVFAVLLDIVLRKLQGNKNAKIWRWLGQFKKNKKQE